MKHKPITLPELVRASDHKELKEAIDCDRTLLLKWERGQRPGWRNLEKLMKFANDHGYTLTILGGSQ